MKRTKYNKENPREHMVGAMLNDEEFEELIAICNLWDYSYSSVIRIAIGQTYSRLVENGMIKEQQNGK